MRVPRLAFTAFASVLIPSLPAALHAQNQVVVHSTIASGFGSGVGSAFEQRAFGGTAPASDPYTMTTKTTTVQKLANGVTITRENISKRAIDSNGRTYNEQHLDRHGAVPNSLTLFDVFDPVSHTNMNWNSDGGVVTVFHQPDPATIQQQPTPQQRQPPVRINFTPAPCPNLQIEDLGMRTILGLTAKGTRTTQTIPAGNQGNDQAFNVTTENWRSPDLNLDLLTITDDPRFGTTTREVTEFQRGEPDPSLFQIPEGYTVKDVNPQN
jgi:hypothetical protein